MADKDNQGQEESVRVFVRIRPLNKREIAEKQTIGWNFNETSMLEDTPNGQKSYVVKFEVESAGLNFSIKMHIRFLYSMIIALVRLIITSWPMTSLANLLFWKPWKATTAPYLHVLNHFDLFGFAILLIFTFSIYQMDKQDR